MYRDKPSLYNQLIYDYDKRLQLTVRMTIIETSYLLLDLRFNEDRDYSLTLSLIRGCCNKSIKSLNIIKKDYLGLIKKFCNLKKEEFIKLNSELNYKLRHYKNEVYQIIEDKEDSLMDLRDNNRARDEKLLRYRDDIKLNYEVEKFEIRMMNEVLDYRIEGIDCECHPERLFNKVIDLSRDSKRSMKIIVDDEVIVSKYSNEIDCMIEDYSNQENFSIRSQFTLFNYNMSDLIKEYRNKIYSLNNKTRIKMINDQYKREIESIDMKFNKMLYVYDIDEEYKRDYKQEFNRLINQCLYEIEKITGFAI